MLSAFSMPRTRVPDDEGGGHVDAEFADVLFGRYDLKQHSASTPDQIEAFVAHFIEKWAEVDGGDIPEMVGVRSMMESQDQRLVDVWRRLDVARGLHVKIASVPGLSNPFVITQQDRPPLIVMCLGIWGLVFECLLGLLTYVDAPAGDDRGLDFVMRAMNAWVCADPSLSNDPERVQAFSVLDLQNTTIAVGMAHCALTWAFFHEVAHIRLGHVHHGTRTALSAAAPGIQASIHSYRHDRELEADRAGVDALLDLMKDEQDIRRTLEFGPAGDHAASILFDIMDLAYRLHPTHDRRISPTHPPPRERSKRLLEYAGTRYSSDGAGFYAEWRRILDFCQERLLLD